MDVEKMIETLTREEKAALVAGTDFMYTNPVPRLGIPSVRMSDGPHGLRVQRKKGDNGTSNSEKATCFPTAATTASSWNPDNLYRMGRAIGRECRHYGVNVVLGPGVNIKRNPLGGRNFEYFSEDPYLAGKMGVAEVQGIQAEGAGVSVKHFALNNSENYRFMGDSIADMRAMREIYLKPFERIVKEACPETLMCAYNKINGEFCSQNYWLLTDVLRKEWGFTGLVMTDWGATHDRLKMLRAGLDLEMPGDTAVCRKWIMDGLASGALDEAVLDEAVRNVLTLVAKHEKDEKEATDFAAHHALAKEIAIDSAVLMQNDGALPLDKDEPLFVCGELFEKMRYQGAGSSMIHPAFLSTPKTAFEAKGVHYAYAKGYRESGIKRERKLIDEALQKATEYEKVIVFAGLTDYVESEGADREDMALPDNQLALIDALLDAGKKVVVVLYGGSPAELPFADRTSAILNMYLPGQNGGEATYSLLFGEVSPSGRLAESWPINYSDVPFGEDFARTKNEVYKESIFVGYRYYLTAKKRVRYPFGYGLSYTRFAYDNLAVVETDNGYEITCDIQNVGGRDGAEVVQLYVNAPKGRVFRPVRELKGFAKIYLKAGEKGKVKIALERDELRYFDTAKNRYVLEEGDYAFEICADCERVILSKTMPVQGEAVACDEKVMTAYGAADVAAMTDEAFEAMSGRKIPALPPSRPIHMESRFTDLKSTAVGRCLYGLVGAVMKVNLALAKGLPEGVKRDNRVKGAIFLKKVLDSSSMITMTMTAGVPCPYNLMEGIVHIANGRIFKGLRCACTRIKAPKLPKKVRRAKKK